MKRGQKVNVKYYCNIGLLPWLQYKQKKIKERYKDQDDEDRQLRMQLLAVIINVMIVLVTIISNSQLVMQSNMLGGRRRRRMTKRVAMQLVVRKSSIKLKRLILT